MWLDEWMMKMMMGAVMRRACLSPGPFHQLMSMIRIHDRVIEIGSME